MAKAQGLSLNTIIIAALVLIVLIVLIVIFSGRMGWFNTTSDSCPGECADTISDCANQIGYKLESCGTSKPICCPSGT
jgi:uncharacterized membrane protein